MSEPAPRRGGRPARAGAASTERITILATEAERADWTARAEVAGKSLSEWMRDRLAEPDDRRRAHLTKTEADEIAREIDVLSRGTTGVLTELAARLRK